MPSFLIKCLVTSLNVFLLTTPSFAEKLNPNWQDRRDYYGKLTDKACAGDHHAYKNLVSGARNKEDPVAKHNLAWLFSNQSCNYKQKNSNTFMSLYQESAEAGYPIAQNNFARYLMEGLYIRQNTELAKRYYKLAIDAGYGNAAVNFGLYYTNAKFLPIDKAKAMTLFNSAIDEGADSKQIKRLVVAIAKSDKLRAGSVQIGSTKKNGTIRASLTDESAYKRAIKILDAKLGFTWTSKRAARKVRRQSFEVRKKCVIRIINFVPDKENAAREFNLGTLDPSRVEWFKTSTSGGKYILVQVQTLGGKNAVKYWKFNTAVSNTKNLNFVRFRIDPNIDNRLVDSSVKTAIRHCNKLI